MNNLATYPDNNDKETNRPLTQCIYDIAMKCFEEICTYFAWLYFVRPVNIIVTGFWTGQEVFVESTHTI